MFCWQLRVELGVSLALEDEEVWDVSEVVEVASLLVGLGEDVVESDEGLALHHFHYHYQNPCFQCFPGLGKHLVSTNLEHCPVEQPSGLKSRRSQACHLPRQSSSMATRPQRKLVGSCLFGLQGLAASRSKPSHLGLPGWSQQPFPHHLLEL